jgi:ribonuclease P protein component
MIGSRFPKRVRLLRAADFERVFTARNSVSNPAFTLHGVGNDVGYPRIGITVSRRVGNAVERNRWKRRVRESFRLSQAELPSLDFVLIARAPAPPSLDCLTEGFSQLARRIERRITKMGQSTDRHTQ